MMSYRQMLKIGLSKKKLKKTFCIKKTNNSFYWSSKYGISSFSDFLEDKEKKKLAKLSIELLKKYELFFLFKEFHKAGYKLYLVGGVLRQLWCKLKKSEIARKKIALLRIRRGGKIFKKDKLRLNTKYLTSLDVLTAYKFLDFDFATTAPLSVQKKIFQKINLTLWQEYFYHLPSQSLSFKVPKYKLSVKITRLRQEKFSQKQKKANIKKWTIRNYLDFLRRDFKFNAIYYSPYEEDCKLALLRYEVYFSFLKSLGPVNKLNFFNLQYMSIGCFKYRLFQDQIRFYRAIRFRSEIHFFSNHQIEEFLYYFSNLKRESLDLSKIYANVAKITENPFIYKLIFNNLLFVFCILGIDVKKNIFSSHIKKVLTEKFFLNSQTKASYILLAQKVYKTYHFGNTENCAAKEKFLLFLNFIWQIFYGWGLDKQMLEYSRLYFNLSSKITKNWYKRRKIIDLLIEDKSWPCIYGENYFLKWQKLFLLDIEKLDSTFLKNKELQDSFNNLVRHIKNLEERRKIWQTIVLEGLYVDVLR